MCAIEMDKHTCKHVDITTGDYCTYLRKFRVETKERNKEKLNEFGKSVSRPLVSAVQIEARH